MLDAVMVSACLLAVARVLSSRLLSTVASSGSSDGTLVRVQFCPEFWFAGPGMFLLQKMLQRPGSMVVSCCAYRASWKLPAGRMVPNRSLAAWFWIVSLMPEAFSCFCRTSSVSSLRLLPVVLWMVKASSWPPLA